MQSGADRLQKNINCPSCARSGQPIVTWLKWVQYRVHLVKVRGLQDFRERRVYLWVFTHSKKIISEMEQYQTACYFSWIGINSMKPGNVPIHHNTMQQIICFNYFTTGCRVTTRVDFSSFHLINSITILLWGDLIAVNWACIACN